MNNCDCNQGRLACTCKPVPPSGDVEVKVFDMKVVMQAIQAVGRLSIPSTNNCHLLSVELNKIVSAHVTRLTAELDAERREHAETERISQQEELRANDYATQLVAAQAELTKARELLQSAAYVLADEETLRPIVAFLVHQSAPAAKGGE